MIAIDDGPEASAGHSAVLDLWFGEIRNNRFVDVQKNGARHQGTMIACLINQLGGR